MEFKHISVLLDETIEELHIKPDGIYVDGTLGGGGHAYHVCQKLSEKGRYIGIDQDADAIAASTKRLAPFKDKVTIVRDNYVNMPKVLHDLGIEHVDGILLDLGVSSFQLDEKERGFTYREDVPLDMRMDQRQSLTARDIVNDYSEMELFHIIRDYGEEKFAKNIAKHIVSKRKESPIETTGQLIAVSYTHLVGDYRRVALYGIDYLLEEKENDFANCGCGVMTDDVIRLREELAEQKKALKDMKEMAQIYGFDISRPAKTAKEAIQWMYFGYLAAIKTQNGAAMSIGRVSTFLDIYIQRDLDKGIITEEEAQEMIDHLTMKFRMVKFARIPSYNQLFSGDPVWATLDLAGIGVDGRSMVTKTDFRFLHTLENMGPSPEPNITVLYSSALPENFKKYAADISIRTSSIQYENDDVMKPVWGDDYAICCCVSATKTGKEMQFFGARANLAKCLLYAINGGVDCKSKQQVGPSYKPIMSEYLRCV